MCPKPRGAGGETRQKPSGHSPLQGRGRFPGWSDRSSVLAHPRRRTGEPTLQSRLRARPYFPRSAASLRIRDYRVHPRLPACCLEISQASRRSPAWRVPLNKRFAEERVAAQRCASLPALKAPLRGRSPWSAPLRSQRSPDHRLQRTDPQRFPPLPTEYSLLPSPSAVHAVSSTAP